MMRLSTGVRNAGIAMSSSALAALPASAHAVAETPTITGNGWVALAIIGAFVGTIYMLIMGALHVERRDATLGRRRDDEDHHGWYGLFGHDGGEGGEGGEGHHW